MSGAKLDILWSPNQDDTFLTFGTDLTLYKVEAIREGAPRPQSVQLSDDTCASVLSINSDHQFMKCLAWYPKPNPDTLLAVGLANGRVILASFGKGSINDINGLLGKEFVPRHARQCHSLAWNPVQTQWIAEGLDRHRSDSSLLIWDINAKYAPDHGLSHDRRSSVQQHDAAISKPFVEIASPETAFSVAWFPRDGRTLVTGMHHKALRVYDLRDVSRHSSFTYTKAVYGVCVDPNFDYRLASFYENQVSVWDMRNFEKPILTQHQGRPVSCISWSPTRCNLLGVLPRDSYVIKLYDILHTSVGTDDLDPAVIERIIQPPGQQYTISSFDWHPKEENRVLTVRNNGAINDIKVFERIALEWSPDINLTWACGRGLMQCNSIKLCREASEDISMLMKRRALRGYGLQTDNIQTNGPLAGDDPKIRALWNWLGYVQSMTPPEDSMLVARSPRGSHGGSTPSTPLPVRTFTRFPGVNSILKTEDGSMTSSKQDFLQWQGIDGQKNKPQKRIFKSEERTRALKLCGWGFSKDKESINESLDRLEGEGQFERSAAIALFNLHIRRAIQAFNRGAASVSTAGGDVNMSMVAMALSGFSDDKNTLWKEICAALSPKLTNPYLRAMFAFLTSEMDSYEEVLDSTMEVIDKVAFACTYLADAKLKDYLDRLTKQLVEDGNLDGILLTGVTEDGVELLERYVDVTSDVQTAAVVMLHGAPLPEPPQPESKRDAPVNAWVSSYRELLDKWRLWHQRAEFDVFRAARERSARPPEQVYVSCTFCGKSVAYSMLASRNRHFVYGATTAHKPKITSCPGCRKPMPRCALCLINMGTAAGTGKRKPGEDEKVERLSQFSNWFTWCQTCRHGGHSNHMTAWFQEHAECPVTGCMCKCVSLDPVSSISSYEDKSPAAPVAVR